MGDRRTELMIRNNAAFRAAMARPGVSLAKGAPVSALTRYSHPSRVAYRARCDSRFAYGLFANDLNVLHHAIKEG